jgi:hypothetical protein
VVLVLRPFQLLIGVQDEDSCGKSSLCETPEAQPRRLTGYPRKAKSCTEINSGIRIASSILKTVKQILANPDTFAEKYVII